MFLLITIFINHILFSYVSLLNILSLLSLLDNIIHRRIILSAIKLFYVFEIGIIFF